MYLNPTASLAHSRNYTALFYSELENNPAPSWLALVFYILLSSVRTEVMAFTKGFPQMREWIGPRKVQSLSEYEVTITKKDNELTVGVSRDDVFFDRFQIIGDKIRGIVTAVPRHFVNYFVTLCLGGFTTKCYDGQNYFDANHPNGTGSVYSNTTAAAISAAEWETAKARAAKIKNPDSGAPLLIRWTHIFFGPNAETAVDKLFGRGKIDGGDDNIHYNKIPEANRTLVQEFGDTAKWFLFDLSKTIKPFLMQIVKGLDFVPFDSPNDWTVFQDRQYVYGIDTMDNATYLLPEVAYGSSVA